VNGHSELAFHLLRQIESRPQQMEDSRQASDDEDYDN
jgi:hypothetical protein